ncbi:MAG TPA: ATP-binding cassette domain-containing protein [Conexibacter sp.]|nr:ATP-binding cassette domain-containing protein [Conexibacter sp.]
MSVSTPVRTVLAARGLCAGYGPVEVLRDVGVEVAAGELVALLGPNGSGKTTLLLTLAGHLRPSAGEVLFEGAAAVGPPHRRARAGLAFLGDDRHLFPSLTVRQSLHLVPGATAYAQERFPRLAGLMDRRTGLLSGGEQQMLGLARALGSGPRALVVDELSLGLAPSVREQLLADLRAAADAGMAVFVVEQNAASVLAVADRAYVLRRGAVVDHRPASAWAGRQAELAELFLS